MHKIRIEYTSASHSFEFYSKKMYGIQSQTSTSKNLKKVVTAKLYSLAFCVVELGIDIRGALSDLQ